MSLLSASHRLMSTIMLRRTKAVVDGDIPPREELTVFIPLTEAQRFWTYRLLTRMDTLTLGQIFKDSAVKKEGSGIISEGRKEVFSHVETQIQQSSSGGAQDRKPTICLTSKAEPDSYLCPRMEETNEFVDAATNGLRSVESEL